MVFCCCGLACGPLPRQGSLVAAVHGGPDLGECVGIRGADGDRRSSGWGRNCSEAGRSRARRNVSSSGNPVCWRNQVTGWVRLTWSLNTGIIDQFAGATLPSCPGIALSISRFASVDDRAAGMDSFTATSLPEDSSPSKKCCPAATGS